MTAEISSLQFFPIKGAQARRTTQLEVSTNVGVVNDRRFGLKKSGDISERPCPFNKMEFEVCANNPKMAAMPVDFILDGGRTINLSILNRRARNAGIENAHRLLQDTGGKYHLCDTAGAQVSFLNLATVRELEKVMGVKVSPARFRMNVWLEGLLPFVEYDWVNMYPGTREITIGDVRFRINDACERCRAPEANPETGEWDLRISKGLRQLMGPRGYKSPHRGVETVMGVYGTVLNDSSLWIGDEVRVP